MRPAATRRLAVVVAAVTPVVLAAALLPGSASASPGADPGDGAGSGSLADAARVYTTHVEPLATIDGVKITGGAYGSSLTAVPGQPDHYYGLTDRGPNVDGPDGEKIEPLPDFQPAIGELVLRPDGTAKLIHRIGLAAHDGVPYNGQVNPTGSTNETITDLDGNVLAPSTLGYDPEGLVALPDGTFWVSDEYGPFITHFDHRGRALERLSPFDGTLPRELAEREPNKGMEGLTITPDGRTLVGIMQAGLDAPDGPKSKELSAIRVVTVNLTTRHTHEYVYLLHNTDGADTGVSEITALGKGRFVVDERDGDLEPGANKKLFLLDLNHATDIGRWSDVEGATYDARAGGLLVHGSTVEAIAGEQDTEQTAAALEAAGITPGTSTLFLDVAGLVSAIDPTGGYFGHDKVEGVTLLDRGRRVLISNDSDFGIDGVNEDAPPYTLQAKLLPDGHQDDGELLMVDRTKVPADLGGLRAGS